LWILAFSTWVSKPLLNCPSRPRLVAKARRARRRLARLLRPLDRNRRCSVGFRTQEANLEINQADPRRNLPRSKHPPGPAAESGLLSSRDLGELSWPTVPSRDESSSPSISSVVSSSRGWQPRRTTLPPRSG
jgi:hypothetical protein